MGLLGGCFDSVVVVWHSAVWYQLYCLFFIFSARAMRLTTAFMANVVELCLLREMKSFGGVIVQKVFLRLDHCSM